MSYYDPLEWTVRDPLEDTVPDPVERRRRMSDGTRRALEVAALIVLVPGFLATQWVDDGHQARNYHAQGEYGLETLTVVPRGGTATLDRVRLKLLGRDATGAPRDDTMPAGAVRLRLVLQVQPLDADHAKNDVQGLNYTVRDRDGHVWSAGGLYDTDNPPVAGAAGQVKVLATVPESAVSSVVLEVRPPASERRKAARPPVLRFAH